MREPEPLVIRSSGSLLPRRRFSRRAPVAAASVIRTSSGAASSADSRMASAIWRSSSLCWGGAQVVEAYGERVERLRRCEAFAEAYL